MSYTPGPNNLLALDGALKLGLKGTAKFLIGIGLGFLTLPCFAYYLVSIWLLTFQVLYL